MPNTLVWEVQGEARRSSMMTPPERLVGEVSEPCDHFGLRADAWFVGQSTAIERLRTRATEAGRQGAAVALIHGEPGSGKEHAAEWMHRCSSRATRHMLLLDAGAEGVHDQLDRIIVSLDASASAGTIVVSNIEFADGATLDRLLRVLANQGISLVCAIYLLSSQSAAQLRERSPLHAQLLSRASGSEIAVPALRHRTGDVAALARRTASSAARRHGKRIRGISPQALSKLENHSFEGDVRELEVMVEQAVLHSSGDWVTVENFSGIHVQPIVRTAGASELVVRLPGSSLREIEIQALRLALEQSGGRIVRASEILGITRHALRRKLEKFGLNDLRANR